MKGSKRSEETKAKISSTKLKNFADPKIRAVHLKNMSEGHNDEKTPIYGIHVKTGERIDLPSVSSVREFGWAPSNVSAALNGRINSAYKYFWRRNNDSN